MPLPAEPAAALTVVVIYEFGKRDEVQPGTRIFVAAAKNSQTGRC